MRRWLLASLAVPLALGLLDPPHPPAPPAVSADAALVLSGDVDLIRVKRAAELYRAGRVGALLVTGTGIGGDSAIVLRREAERLGVPAAAIEVEPRSHTTRENLAFSAPIVRDRGWRRVALVTSASHAGRALRVARRELPGVSWIGVPVADAGPWRRIYRQRLAEWIKLAADLALGWA